MTARDKKATEEKIIHSVGALLARSGFSGLGINAIAREAGIGKTLIYRYFGGLPQLVRAYAREGDFWPLISELTEDSESFRNQAPREKVKIMFSNYIRAIRRRKLTLEILAWEMVEKNELTHILEKKREEFSDEIFNFMSQEGINSQVDIRTMIGIMGAGVNYLASRSRNNRYFSGMDLKSREDWGKIEETIHGIIDRMVE